MPTPLSPRAPVSSGRPRPTSIEAEEWMYQKYENAALEASPVLSTGKCQRRVAGMSGATAAMLTTSSQRSLSGNPSEVNVRPSVSVCMKAAYA